MTDHKPASFASLMREQLATNQGFSLLEEAIGDCRNIRKDLNCEASIRLTVLGIKLGKALSLLRDIGPDISPRPFDDGLHTRLRDAHEWMECVLGLFFLFQKEWEEGFAYDLEQHCAGLHDASKAIVKHLETVGFA